MLTPEDERKIVEEMTRIFLEAFAEASERAGVPIHIVAQQFVNELEKRAADRKRLDDSCIEYDPAQDPDHPMQGWLPENNAFE